MKMKTQLTTTFLASSHETSQQHCRDTLEEIKSLRPDSYFQLSVSSVPSSTKNAIARRLGFRCKTIAASVRDKVLTKVGIRSEGVSASDVAGGIKSGKEVLYHFSPCWSCCVNKVDEDELIIESLQDPAKAGLGKTHVFDIDFKVFANLDVLVGSLSVAALSVSARMQNGVALSDDGMVVVVKFASAIHSLAHVLGLMEVGSPPFNEINNILLRHLPTFNQILGWAQPFPNYNDLIDKVSVDLVRVSSGIQAYYGALVGSDSEVKGIRPSLTINRASEGDWRDFVENHVFRDIRYVLENIALSNPGPLAPGISDIAVGSTHSTVNLLASELARSDSWFKRAHWFVYSRRCGLSPEVRELADVNYSYGLRGRPTRLGDLANAGEVPNSVVLIANYIWLQWQMCPNQTPKALAGVRAQSIVHFTNLFRDQVGGVIEWVNFICSQIMPIDKDF